MLAANRIATRYELKERLGEGGMGVVYRAFDNKTRSDVAIKTMRDVSDPAAVELFAREWSVLAGMSHPNIVDVRDAGEIEEHGRRIPFFVMPLLNGSTLAKLIETSSPRINPSWIVELVRQVCRGLQAAHERGLIHRDLKPSNIFVLDDDTAKIIDFGVVHLAGAQSVTGHKGTWQYMAPEMTRLQPATPASDIFSLGVICYEALTGRRPFARKAAVDTVDAIQHYSPPPVAEMNPSVPELMSMSVHTAMAKQPAHRFQTARDFADTLHRAYLGLPIERFDNAKIQPRIGRAKTAFAVKDYALALEIMDELRAEGHADPEIGVLRTQIEVVFRQQKIGQLMEIAHVRIEQDEVSLALERLGEILQLDPEHADALALKRDIEQRRADRQVGNCLGVARRSLEQGDFIQARRALRDALCARPADSKAAQLLSEVEEKEQSAVRAGAERERLYESAVRAYQSGEIKTALEKMQKVLSLGKSGSHGTPGRDAVYRSFYSQISSELETITSAYEEARRSLVEKDFPAALEICERVLAQHPGYALFQALQLEVVENQREELHSYIAASLFRAENEPDLDRRMAALQEAAGRYPDEPQFQQALKLVRGRRDLVNSIVARARQYEEQNQFAEALGQWEMLRSIYPRYPGLAFEMEHLTSRCEWQAKEESRALLVDQIDHALDARAFAKARELAAAALVESPQDQEFAGLERLARQGLERSREASELLEAAQTAGESGQRETQVEILRQAMDLDDANPAIRTTLATVLVAQARALIEEDWRKAEALADEAGNVDNTHTALRGLRSMIGDATRKERVSQCLAEARDLQAQGKWEGALSLVSAALADYPGNARLTQYRALLLGVSHATSGDTSRHRTNPNATPVARAAASISDLQQPAVDPGNDSGPSTVLFSPSQFLREHADDATPPKVPPLRKRGLVELRAYSQSLGRRIAPLIVRVKDASRRTLATIQQSRAWAAAKRPQVRLRLDRSTWFLLGGFLLVALIAGARLYSPSPTTPPQQAPKVPRQVRIKTAPKDALVTIDGRIQNARLIDLTSDRLHTVTISAPGYVPLRRQEEFKPNWTFSLVPQPLHLRIFTAEQQGKVFLDGREAGSLTGGALPDLEIAPDGAAHRLDVRIPAGDLFSASFEAKPGVRPAVQPIQTKDLIAISSLESDATVHSGTAGRRLAFPSQPPQSIPSEGLDLHGVTSKDRQFTLVAYGSQTFSIDTGNSPVLAFFLRSNPFFPSIIVSTDAPHARVFLDNTELNRPPMGNWWVQRSPGTYTLRVTAQGFLDYENKITLLKGDALGIHADLKPAPLVSTMTIRNGTPGAEVLIAGRSAGRLDDSGSFSNSQIPPGEWVVELRKAGHESKQLKLSFSAGQAVVLSSRDATVTALGSLEFAISPASAHVQYEQDGRTSEGRTSGALPVSAGRYRVSASAEGFEGKSVDVTVQPGETARASFALPPVAVEAPPAPASAAPAPAMESFFPGARGLQRNPDGLSLTLGETAWFARGTHDLTLSVIKADSKRRLQLWIVSDKNTAMYEFAGRRVSRTATLGGKRQNATLLKLGKDAAYITIELHITKDRIVLTSGDGTVSDDLKSDAVDFTTAKVGISGEAHFKVRID